MKNQLRICLAFGLPMSRVEVDALGKLIQLLTTSPYVRRKLFVHVYDWTCSTSSKPPVIAVPFG